MEFSVGTAHESHPKWSFAQAQVSAFKDSPMASPKIAAFRLPVPRIAGLDAARTSLATYRFARLPSRQYFAARVEVDLRDLNGHGGRLNRSVGKDGAHNCKI